MGTLPYLWANGRIALNTMGKYFLLEQSGKRIRIYNWWECKRIVCVFFLNSIKMWKKTKKFKWSKNENLQWVRLYDNFSLSQSPILKFDRMWNWKWILIILNACICMFSFISLDRMSSTLEDCTIDNICLILKFHRIPNWKWIVMTLNTRFCIFSLTYMWLWVKCKYIYGWDGFNLGCMHSYAFVRFLK